HDEARELVSYHGIAAADRAASGGERGQIARIAGRIGERDRAALVGEHGHGDLPSLAQTADQVGPWHAGLLEEDLAELALSGNLPQWAYRHTGGVELDQDERDPAVAVLRIGARQDEDPVGPGAEGRPDLLAVE